MGKLTSASIIIIDFL